MVDTADNKELYDDIAAIQAKEKANTPVSDEEKTALLARLNEMANSSVDFDPDRLESIEAFAASFGNNSNAEAILKRIAEQKAKAEANSAQQQDTPTNQPNEPTAEEKKLDIANEPSYSVYKEYEALKGKENLTDDEKARMTQIEQFSSQMLDNVDTKNIEPDAAVALSDYLGVASLANPEAAQEKYQELQSVLGSKLQEYDQANGLENAAGKTPEEMKANEDAWNQVATQIDVKPVLKELNPILSELPKEEQLEILSTLQRTVIFDLKDNAPDANGVQTMQTALENNVAEFNNLVKAEYLKQTAKAQFCEQNKIEPKKFEELLMKSAKGETLSEEEKGTLTKYNEHTAKVMSDNLQFNGPYKNKEFLKNAIEVTRAQMISRSTTKECRRSRLMNAQNISSRVAKMNKDFALNYPKTYKVVNIVKNMGVNALRSAAIGAALGPVGLTAYSAFKTMKTIRKAYKEHQAENGGNFKDFVKSLAKPENRSKALTLAGQVAATAISGYFSLGGGMDGIVDNLGLAGKAIHSATGAGTEHIANAAAQATQHIDSVGGALKAGATKIFNSPRRLVSMSTSLGIGIVKGLSEKYNLNKAHKNMTKILEANGVAADKKLLKAFEKAQAPEEFQALLKEVVPNISQEQAQELLNNADLARKSNPKSVAAATIAGATLGLVASAAAETYSSHVAEANAAAGNADTGNTALDAEMKSTLAHQETIDGWNKGSDQRFESFGIDAEGANKMLREMGIIKEGDHTFYKQSGLTKLVSGANLTDEQRNQIQGWANDRESRVANMLKCIREHHHGGHRSSESAGHTGIEVKSVDPKSLGNLNNNEEVLKVNPNEKIIQPTTDNNYHVEGVINKNSSINGDVQANDPLSAASAVAHANGANGARRSEFTVTDGRGNQTEINSKVGSRSTVVKATYHKGDAENGDVIGKQKIKSYTSGKSEGSTKIVERRDIDGDGKKDKIETVISKDGSRVTYAKLSRNGDRILATDDGHGNRTAVSANEKAEQDGTGKSSARQTLKSTFNNLSRHFRGKDGR